jgi:dUTP pyrophosphatase
VSSPQLDPGSIRADRPVLLVMRLRPDAVLPVYAQPGDAGADVCAVEEVTLAPGARALVPTGLAIAIPEGHAVFVHPRSGLAVRHGVTLLNTPGTIDAGYRGEVKVLMVNLDPAEPVTIRAGDRIAQLVVQPVAEAVFVVADELPESARGTGGFGSTGGFGPTSAAGAAGAATTAVQGVADLTAGLVEGGV